MSGDTARRKQYAELKPTENKPPFEKWQDNSLNILSGAVVDKFTIEADGTLPTDGTLVKPRQ